MLLADLDLSALPSDVIQSLIESLQQELIRRKALGPLPQPKPLYRRFHELQTRFGYRTYEEEIAYLTALYSSALYALPKTMLHQKLKRRMPYLSILLAQDWTSVFPQAATTTSDYYVYAHIDPRESPTPLLPKDLVLQGQPFYIGKGSGRRAWDLKRNQGHGKRIQRLRNLGYADTSLVSIIADALTEREALILEAKLIYFFGSIYDDTVKGFLLNLADHMRPTFIEAMQPLPQLNSYYAHLRRQASEAVRKKEKPSSIT